LGRALAGSLLAVDEAQQSLEPVHAGERGSLTTRFEQAVRVLRDGWSDLYEEFDRAKPQNRADVEFR
jgi:hypothetical protein